MFLVDYLAATGPATAAFLIGQTGRTHESVYAELVREEAQGRVRIMVDGQHVRRWAAADDELPPALRGGALEAF